MQLASKTLQQYANNRIAKWFKVADIYAKSALNDVSVEGASHLTRHSLRNLQAAIPQADLTDIAM